ncbi:HAD-IA family hydrolase [Consotaella aegiceratis]|uniref:HAD-IA family hydrolase n=1 Tax=Consotaella aegiceratis TaxID=3097961 RepID=UPI002F40C679
MRLILFDCDGTLVDSAATICATMQRAFASRGLAEPAEDAIRRTIGLSLGEVMARLHPAGEEADHDDLVAAYREAFLVMRASGAPAAEALFDGVHDLLARLRKRDDVILGIVTGKGRRGVVSFLETYALGGHFLTIRTADDCPSKPHPAMVLESCLEAGVDPADALVVGDAVFDIAMARAAGAAGIGVTWGNGETSALLEAGAQHVVNTMDELETLLAAWIDRGPSIVGSGRAAAEAAEG